MALGRAFVRLLSIQVSARGSPEAFSEGLQVEKKTFTGLLGVHRKYLRWVGGHGKREP